MANVLILIDREQYNIIKVMLQNIEKPDYPDNKKRSHATAIINCIDNNKSDC